MGQNDQVYLQAAIAQAKKSYQEGGIPIGAALVLDEKIVGQGHNRRVQSGDPILHGETDCIRNAGRLSPQQYRRSTLFTTLSPCAMCTGAILLYGIPRVVIGENMNFVGSEGLLIEQGVELTIVQDREIAELLAKFIADNPELWFEDIGELSE